jgi:hypothetical protein
LATRNISHINAAMMSDLVEGDLANAAAETELNEAGVYWCLGVYGSASTWLYNVVKSVGSFRMRTTIRTHFFSEQGSFSEFDQPNLTHIVKSHEISDEPTILELERRCKRIIISLRDPRDAVSSLMLYHKQDFKKSLALVEAAMGLCLRFVFDRRTLLLHYEDEFYQDTLTLDRIAAHLGVDLAEPDRHRIFASMQRTEVERYISHFDRLPGVLYDRLSGDRLDPKTHWHTHHAGRTGEIGRWTHMLTNPQVKQVEDRLHRYYELSR